MASSNEARPTQLFTEVCMTKIDGIAIFLIGESCFAFFPYKSQLFTFLIDSVKQRLESRV